VWGSINQLQQPEITIKELRVLEEAEDCEDLQVRIWPPQEGSAGYYVPIHLLISQMEIGGIVLGAYLDQRIVGFIFAVQAYDKQCQCYHYSCLAGVHPEFQHNGIMEKLKWKHADLALDRKVNRIVWTYDPLQGPNANLNIRKLGGSVREYKTNYYGVRAGGSPRNSGIPSDRFVLEWNLRQRDKSKPSLRARDLVNSRDCSLVNMVETDEGGLPSIKEYDLGLTTHQLLVEIPDDFERIRRHPSKSDLDLDWRLKSREIFSHYLNNGYHVGGFISEKEGTLRKSFYLLERLRQERHVTE
jgi:predicted GNAT superfamily acetyltransferase